jgi:hypothetical protein
MFVLNGLAEGVRLGSNGLWAFIDLFRFAEPDIRTRSQHEQTSAVPPSVASVAPIAREYARAHSQEDQQ